jgi:ectoine hydroxylase-related dioxygenase (phytanoyl-CoA dioxygenase family)
MRRFVTTVALKESIDFDGFAIVEQALSRESVSEIVAALERLNDSTCVRKREGIFAVRNLLDASPEILELARSAAVRELVKPILGERAFLVRGILFDKIPDANWKVPWHQDLTIAVMQRVDVEGFGPWSMKAGVHHVQPPGAVLEDMLTVRLHLDDCGQDNGALRVLPGSHRGGKIPEKEITAHIAAGQEEVCEVRAGGALLMRPCIASRIFILSFTESSSRHPSRFCLNGSSYGPHVGSRWHYAIRDT